MVSLWVLVWFLFSSFILKGLGGAAMGVWLLQAVLALLCMFTNFNWEGWLVLGLVYLGGVLVLMLYMGCSDGQPVFTGGLLLYLSSFAIMFKIGATGFSPSQYSEALWFVSSSCSVLLASGVILCGVMVVVNTFIYVSEGTLRSFSHYSICVHKLVSFKVKWVC